MALPEWLAADRQLESPVVADQFVEAVAGRLAEMDWAHLASVAGSSVAGSSAVPWLVVCLVVVAQDNWAAPAALGLTAWEPRDGLPGRKLPPLWQSQKRTRK